MSEAVGKEPEPIDPDLDPPAEPRPQRRRGTGGRAASRRPGVLGAIAVGGVLGASARYGVARLWPVAAGRFPWATFWTNVTGSLVLGFAIVLIAERFPPSRYVRPFVATGFIGAYTTFSTYTVETDVLIKDGHVVTAVVYAAGSLLAGLGAVWAGVAAGRAASAGSTNRTPRRQS